MPIANDLPDASIVRPHSSNRPRVPTSPSAADLTAVLERDGIVTLPNFLSGNALASIQDSFARTLARPNFNTWIGYEQNEKWRVLVENLLMLDPHCVTDCAVHPVVAEVLRQYIGPEVALVEARGWKTIRTKRTFHGWHEDAWYHPSVTQRPREVKLAVYLTDVTSGHFSYITGSHLRPGNEFPRHWAPREVAAMMDRALDVKGPAGTAFLFDTAGVHRQTTPVLEPRNVMFFNYHDPAVPLQDEDVQAGRYRPLALNAGFLPAPLTAEQASLLGFGRARSGPAYQAVIGRANLQRYPLLHDAVAFALATRLEAQEINRTVRQLRRAVSARANRAVAALAAWLGTRLTAGMAR